MSRVTLANMSEDKITEVGKAQSWFDLHLFGLNKKSKQSEVGMSNSDEQSEATDIPEEQVHVGPIESFAEDIPALKVILDDPKLKASQIDENKTFFGYEKINVKFTAVVNAIIAASKANPIIEDSWQQSMGDVVLKETSSAEEKELLAASIELFSSLPEPVVATGSTSTSMGMAEDPKKKLEAEIATKVETANKQMLVAALRGHRREFNKAFTILEKLLCEFYPGLYAEGLGDAGVVFAELNKKIKLLDEDRKLLSCEEKISGSYDSDDDEDGLNNYGGNEEFNAEKYLEDAKENVKKHLIAQNKMPEHGIDGAMLESLTTSQKEEVDGIYKAECTQNFSEIMKNLEKWWVRAIVIAEEAIRKDENKLFEKELIIAFGKQAVGNNYEIPEDKLSELKNNLVEYSHKAAEGECPGEDGNSKQYINSFWQAFKMELVKVIKSEDFERAKSIALSARNEKIKEFAGEDEYNSMHKKYLKPENAFVAQAIKVCKTILETDIPGLKQNLKDAKNSHNQEVLDVMAKDIPTEGYTFDRLWGNIKYYSCKFAYLFITSSAAGECGSTDDEFSSGDSIFATKSFLDKEQEKLDTAQNNLKTIKSAEGFFYTTYTKELKAALKCVIKEDRRINNKSNMAIAIKSKDTELTFVGTVKSYYHSLLDWVFPKTVGLDSEECEVTNADAQKPTQSYFGAAWNNIKSFPSSVRNWISPAESEVNIAYEFSDDRTIDGVESSDNTVEHEDAKQPTQSYFGSAWNNIKSFPSRVRNWASPAAPENTIGGTGNGSGAGSEGFNDSNRGKGPLRNMFIGEDPQGSATNQNDFGSGL